MALLPQISPGVEQSRRFEEWIDQATADATSPHDVAARIAQITRPGGTADYEASPELLGNEAWLWPWNRAGFNYVRGNRPEDAATVFTCAYLAALHFQNHWQYRIHKGMPLCNIAYAYLMAGTPRPALVPAILGIAEDAITAGNPTETASFRNLLAAGVDEYDAQLQAHYLLLHTRRLGLSPLYPEMVLESRSRFNVIPSEPFLRRMQEIAAGFAPETIGKSLESLFSVWRDFKLRWADAITRSATEHGEPAGALAAPVASAPSGGAPFVGSQAISGGSG